MPAPTLYNWSPLALLLLGGVLLALGPLLWVAFRNRHTTTLRRVQALTVFTLFLTFDLVIFGTFTRLTDSGLGCPDWPGCYGKASPVGAHVEINSAQSAMPSGPVTPGKAWVEMIHRYLATSVGVLILVLALAAWWRSWTDRQPPPVRTTSAWWPTLTLLWVCIQGAFGAWTVTLKLFPAIVTLHLLGGLVLLALLCLQAVRHAQLENATEPVTITRALRWLLAGSFALLILQVALGGWVSTNYAVLACRDFPQCQGSWWPLMDFSRGFELWRELGLTSHGAPIDFAALTAIHYLHRVAALIVLLALGALAWQLNRIPALRTQSRWIAALTGLQLATGVTNVVMDWPMLAALAHTGGAAALVVVLTWALASTTRDPAGQSRRTGSARPPPVRLSA